MGIIAGIAIPTTIAVINRQKKNSAVKSAQNVFNAAKDLLLEAQAGEAAVAGVTAGGTGDSFTYKTTAADMTTSGDLEKNPCSTSFTITINSSNQFGVVEATVTINNIVVTVNTNAETHEVTFTA